MFTSASFLRQLQHRNALHAIHCFHQSTAAASPILLRSAAYNSNFSTNSLAYYSTNHSSENKQKPIVCLYGWLGCKPQHLAKFEKMYNELGYETVPFIPSLTSTLLESSAQRNAEQMLKLIQQTAEKHHSNMDANQSSDSQVSFVAHSFSGNGIYTFGRTLDLATKSNMPLNYRGLVFDSTPPKIDADRFTRGFVGAVKSLNRSGAAQDLDPSFYHHWLLSPIARFIFNQFVKHYKGHYEEFQERVLNQMPKDIPALFIYSQKDVLVPPEDVEAFMGEMTKRGATQVDSLFFKDSGHIMHMKMHPEAYRSKVQEFLQKCQQDFTTLDASQEDIKK